LRWLALMAALAAVGVMVLGGISAAPSSAALNGAPCLGHWPVCNGRLALTLAEGGPAEIAHRAAAGALIPLVAGLAVVAFRQHRPVRWIVGPALLALGLVAMRLMIGAVAWPAALSAAVAALHSLIGLTLTAALVLTAVVAWRIERDPRFGRSLLHFDLVSRLAGMALIGIFATQVLGAALTTADARTSCAGRLLCQGLAGPVSGDQLLAYSHRLLAAGAGVLVAAAVWSAWRYRSEDSDVLAAASVTGALYVGQAMIGAANVLNGYPLPLAALHSATSPLAWASAVVFVALAMQAVRLKPLTAPAPALRWAEARRVIGSYLLLTKPFIMILLLITTWAAMAMAWNYAPAGSTLGSANVSWWPPLEVVAWTMLGGALASGGASALNQVIDIDLDRRMARTSRRPLAQGAITPAQGLAFGLVLTVLAFYVLAVFVNLTAAIWAMIGSAYYVVGYSILLKLSTPQNIVIGGGAGAIPPIVGWAAVTGTVTAPAWFLFAIVFFWTPPHFWALSLLKKNDYARAGVPMLPVVWGEAETRRQIVLYTFVLVALTLLLWVAQVSGLIYAVAATVLGLGFIALALRLWRAPSNQNAFRLYKYSSYYLAAIFAVLVIDRLYFFGL
jgi:protoheme IX farnesyltransferase